MENISVDRNFNFEKKQDNTVVLKTPINLKLLFLISIEILSFRTKAIDFCEQLLKQAKNMDTFFNSPQEAVSYLDTLSKLLENNSVEKYMILYAEFIKMLNSVQKRVKEYDQDIKENAYIKAGKENSYVKGKKENAYEGINGTCIGIKGDNENQDYIDLESKEKRIEFELVKVECLEIKEEGDYQVECAENINDKTIELAELGNLNNPGEEGEKELYDHRTNLNREINSEINYQDDRFPEFDTSTLQAMKEFLNVSKTMPLSQNIEPDANASNFLCKIDKINDDNIKMTCNSIVTEKPEGIQQEIIKQDPKCDNQLFLPVENNDPKNAEQEILDLISTCDSDSSLELSSSSSASTIVNKKKRRDHKKIAEMRKWRVKISSKEQQLCDKLIKKSNGFSTEPTSKKAAARRKRLSTSSSSSSSSSSRSTISRSHSIDNNDCDASYQSYKSDYSTHDGSDTDGKHDSDSDFDILINISDNSMSSIDSTDDEDNTVCNKNKVKMKTKKVKPIATGYKDEYNEEYNDDNYEPIEEMRSKADSSWRHDPLLRDNDDSGSSDLDIKPKIRSSLQSGMTILLEETEDEDSDIEFISSSSVKRKREHDDEIESSPNKKGRRNIREVLSESQLNQATKDAHTAEKERIERLKTKQKNLQELSQSMKIAPEDIVLDACEDNLIVVHRALTHKLKEHQKAGVKFMWDNCYESVKRLREDSGGGCILAHCMGLGKTLQVITLVHTLFVHPVTNTKKVLIICPLSTVINWRAEFRAAMKLVKDPLPSMIIYTIGKEDRRSVIRQWNGTGGVLLMGYDSYVAAVKADIEMMNKVLVNPGPDLVVCDEGHLLKSGKSDRTLCISNIGTRRRIILTGTPMQNNLEEYYYMVAFVKPQFLGSFPEYRNRFVNPIKNGQFEDSSYVDIKLMKKRSHVLHKMTKSFIQRYEESELFQHLPNKYDYALKIELHDAQIKLYQKFVGLCENNKKNLFANLYNIRLICTHPRMLELQQAYALKTKPNRPQTELQEQLLALNNTIDPNWWVNDVPNDIHTNYTYGPKLAVMMSIIKTSIELDEKLLVFSNSRLELTLIELFLKADNSNWKLENTYYRMDGTVPVIKRNEYCETFNDPNSPIKLFLLTNKVGGLGLNLTGANRAIIMDVSWNPSLDTQSIFRIYRLGQKKPCFVYRFIAKGTMEEVIYDRSVTKQAISGRVVDKMQITRHFKSFEIEEMYRCDLEKRPRPMLKLPKDDVLANLLKQHTCIYSYEDHKELLQNLPDEELDEDEMKLAWEEYEKEKNFVPKPYPISPSTSGVNASFTSRVDKFPAAIQPTSNVEKNYSSTPISKTIADQNQAQDPLILFETDKGSVIARFTPDGEIVPDKPCNVTPEQIQTAKDLKIGPQTGLSRVFVIATNGNLKNFNQWRIPRKSKRFTPRQKNLVVSEVINLADDNSDASTISNEIAENVIDIPIIELDD